MTETNRDARGKPALTERLVKAFHHPVRKSILLCLVQRGRPISPVETSKELKVGMSNASYHFDVLADLNLISLHHTRRKRGATEHFYEPKDEILGHPLLQAFLDEEACA